VIEDMIITKQHDSQNGSNVSHCVVKAEGSPEEAPL